MAVNILVVEDSMSQARIIQATLTNEGHNIFILKDGTGLLNTIIDNKIDVLLLDIVLPGLDGFELLNLVMNCTETCDIPTIMVTGLTSGYDVKRALDMGALDYVKKPIDSVELIARLNSAIRLKAKQDMLKEFAIRDKLTRLYNRLYFDDVLPKLIEDLSVFENGLSLAMIDCDYFKRVNDSYGHVAGDMVLEAVANVIIKSTKSKDIVCRYGGEEFCLILLNTDLQQAFFISERVRRNVAKMKFRFDESDVGITISIGVANLPPTEKASALELLDRADQALYVAKSNGRNRVEIEQK